jgi:hypothetical protein
MRFPFLVGCFALTALQVFSGDAHAVVSLPTGGAAVYQINNLAYQVDDVVAVQLRNGNFGNSSLFTLSAGTSTFTDPYGPAGPITAGFLVGVSTFGDSDHLVFLANTGFVASATGQAFDAVFGGSTSESDLIYQLQNYDTTDLTVLIGFLQSNASTLATPIGGAFQPFAFSNGQTIGDVGALLAVPEPSTWALMLLGFAGLGWAGYRTSRKGASAVV